MNQVQPRTLYVVGTPIGNLGDMTFRGVQVLREVDAIAAEDTRHTGRLLQHFQIATPQVSYHHYNRQRRVGELLTQLNAGDAIALVTDAGMPGISDPGYELVKACVEAGLGVIPIPGVTAAVTALATAGLPTDRFVFEGFLPTKESAKRDRLAQIQGETRTLIFYEAPHRLQRTLADLATVLGEHRPVVLARELTKLHEEFWRGTLGEAIVLCQDRPPKGEFTLVVGGAVEADTMILTEGEMKAELRRLLQEGMTRSQASRHLAQFTPFSRREIYQFSLTLRDLPIEGN